MFLDARMVAAEELVEHLWQLIFGNADARVFDAHLDLVIGHVYAEGTRPPRWRVLHRVAQQVDQQRRDLVLVQFRFRHLLREHDLERLFFSSICGWTFDTTSLSMRVRSVTCLLSDSDPSSMLLTLSKSSTNLRKSRGFGVNRVEELLLLLDVDHVGKRRVSAYALMFASGVRSSCVAVSTN